MSRIITTTPPFVLMFNHLFEPHSLPNFPAAQKKYGCSMWFQNKADASVLSEALEEEGQRFFGVGQSFNTYLKSGYAPYESWYQVSARSIRKPLLRVHLVEDLCHIAERGSIRNGDSCIAEVAPAAFEAYGHKGVVLELLSLTKIEESPVSEEQAALLTLKEQEGL